MDLFNTKGALFSPCRKYRYRLWRIWDDRPKVMFIGLNPSTANEVDPDRTITRVVNFAHAWGYGGVYMTNLFALVSTQPEALLTCEDPIKDNDIHLKEVAQLCGKIIFAWGTFKVNGRDEVIKKMFPGSFTLKHTKHGRPYHPLYVHSKTIPEPFKY